MSPTKIASLYAEISADTSKLDAGLKSTKAGLKQADDGIGNITKSIKGMAVAMGIGLSVGAVVDFAKKAVSAASDLNETMSKSKVVFGDAADEIEKMGNTAASALGMSKNEAVAAAATYGNLFVSMGLASDKSADMSKNMVQLAADLGSFNNLPTADVLEKLRAGLTGEAEPLKSLGININEVMLKQEALNLGLWDGKGVLDAATKAQAAYSLMLKQSTTAQGDFARTADGAANQTKILESKTADLTAELGTKLLPAWKLVLETGVDAIDNLAKLVEMTNNYSNVLADHDKDVLKTAKSYQDYVDEMVRSAKAADIMVDAQGNIRNGWGFVIDKLDLATEAEYNQTHAIAILKQAADAEGPSVDALTTYWEGYTSAAGGASNASKGLVTSLADEQKALDLLSNTFQTAISGGMAIFESQKNYQDAYKKTQNGIVTLTQEIDTLSRLRVMTPEQSAQVNDVWGALQRAKDKAGEFAQMSDGDLKNAVKNLNGELWNLTQGTYLTDAQKQQLIDARDELAKQKTALEDLEKAHTIETNKMVFNMLLTKAASDGLSTAEFDNLMHIGVGMGLLSQDSADMATNLNAINLDDANAQLGSVDAAIASIMGQPNSKNINVSVTTKYTNIGAPASPTVAPTDFTVKHATGGSWTIPPGFNENYPVSPGHVASSGETVTVTPAGQSGQGFDYDRLARIVRDAVLQVAG